MDLGLYEILKNLSKEYPNDMQFGTKVRTILKEIGGNIKPGQGTRERFKKEVEKELPKPEIEKKPDVNPEEDIEGKNLQESLKRIKRLMFS
jgi:hypothetical protein